jgi:glutathione S-transferase
MDDPRPLRLFGSELSPYSVKVRSYLRYKRIPHDWVLRDSTTLEEFQRHARLPLIPLVLAPDGTVMQDSTPIIEALEAKHPEPSIHPPEVALAFLSALIEEYADEWGNKPMFHYRWFYEPDEVSAADRIARETMPGATQEALGGACEMIRQRMVPRLRFVGSSEQTKELIEGSFRRQLAILEVHLAQRRYLFGDRPAFADFGLFAQLYQCSTDPTPAALMRRSAPGVLAWVARMLDPRAEGEFETWPRLEPTLAPLLREEVGAVFLPWTLANARALAAGEKEFSVELRGRPFSQETQRYHAKSLGALRARYAGLVDRSALDPVLRATGCFEALQAAA